MADQLYVFSSQPGVRRDGTDLDAPYYNDPIWVRWQRGKPRKIGGYQSMTTVANGPVRAVMLDARGGVYSTHLFSQWGIQRVQFAFNGSAGAIEDRTPAGFVADANLNWSYDSMYSATGGAYSAIIASSSPDVLDIASDSTGYIYAGNIANNEPLVQVADGSGAVRTSGGICVLPPFLFVYGSNGLIRNSNTNDYSAATGWTIGGANLAASNNVSASKIVYGQAIRGGSQAPAGLFWGMDSLFRVSFIGGTSLWQYDTLACPTTVLSKNSIVEHEGKFFWPGVDRFMFYNGVVQELANQMNANYFFDNINWTYRNKIWGVKVARFGEIWWFYPRGTDTECGNAVIFNYRENTWYDAAKQRTAGAPAGVFRFPVWAGHEDSTSTTLLTTGLNLVTSAATLAGSPILTFTATTGVVDGMAVFGTGIPNNTFVLSHTGTTVTLTLNTTGVAISATIAFTSMTVGFVNNNTVTGGTSGATGTAVRVLTNGINVSNVVGTFVSGETITGLAGATAKLQSAPVAQTLVTQYQQEFGWDKTVGANTTAILSGYTSANFGFATGGPFDDVPKTMDALTRITRIEPDFNQNGTMTLEVVGRSFAQDTEAVINTYQMGVGDSFKNMGDQARIMKLKFSSNTLGGFYEQGQIMVTLEPGDERSTK